VIDIEHHAVRALEQDPLSALRGYAGVTQHPEEALTTTTIKMQRI